MLKTFEQLHESDSHGTRTSQASISPSAKKVLAASFGTFCLVFVGCGAIMTNEIAPSTLGHLGISIAFGLVVMTMISATGHVSGAHLNPAVTIAFAATGNFRWKEVPGYIFGQVTAALLASLSLESILGDVAFLGATQPTLSLGSTFFLEVIISMILMFVITAVATDSRAEGQNAAWAIGGTVAIAALFAGPLCGHQ